MKTPRNVNGDDLAKHLQKDWHYARVHQTGSHIIMRTQIPTQHSVSIPAHKPLKVGTLQSILKPVAEHKNITVDDLLKGL